LRDKGKPLEQIVAQRTNALSANQIAKNAQRTHEVMEAPARTVYLRLYDADRVTFEDDEDGSEFGTFNPFDL
jgi:hypothetical protein